MIEIELKPFERIDFPRLIGWIKTPEFLLQWAGPIFSYPLNGAQREDYIRGSEVDPPVRKIFKVVDISSNGVVGHIDLDSIDLDSIDLRNRSATVGRVLVGEPPLRGKEIGSQMLKKLLEIGFSQLGSHRIDLFIFDFNRAAIRCYEKVGFRKEGHLREARKIGNEYWSLYQMSILEHEWKQKRKLN